MDVLVQVFNSLLVLSLKDCKRHESKLTCFLSEALRALAPKKVRVDPDRVIQNLVHEDNCDKTKTYDSENISLTLVGKCI